MQRWACVSALTDALQRLSVHGAMRLQGMFSFQGIQKQARWKFWSLPIIESGRHSAAALTSAITSLARRF